MILWLQWQALQRLVSCHMSKGIKYTENYGKVQTFSYIMTNPLKQTRNKQKQKTIKKKSKNIECRQFCMDSDQIKFNLLSCASNVDDDVFLKTCFLHVMHFIYHQIAF